MYNYNVLLFSFIKATASEMGKKSKVEEPAVVEEEEEYEVERVLEKRLVRGKVQYLIKWKGFSKCVINPFCVIGLGAFPQLCVVW